MLLRTTRSGLPEVIVKSSMVRMNWNASLHTSWRRKTEWTEENERQGASTVSGKALAAGGLAGDIALHYRRLAPCRSLGLPAASALPLTEGAGTLAAMRCEN